MSHSLPHISLPQSEDLESLRLTAERAINITIDRINAQKLTADLDMQQLRITNLARPASLRDAVNVEYLQKALAEMAKRLRDATHILVDEGGGGGGGSSFTVTWQAVTLTTNPTNIVASVGASEGNILIVRLAQDATGGRNVTWDGGTFGYGPTGIDGTPTKVSIIPFVGYSDGLWWPITEAPSIGL